MSAHLTIPARHGIAAHVKAGQTIKMLNTNGTQVVDTWSFTLSSTNTILTQLSMQHTHANLKRIHPRIGDGLYDNNSEILLTLTEDTAGGCHDTLIAACDRKRYEKAGVVVGHANCADNLVEGLDSLGSCRVLDFVPKDLELFGD